LEPLGELVEAVATGLCSPCDRVEVGVGAEAASIDAGTGERASNRGCFDRVEVLRGRREQLGEVAEGAR
jgi:hypothetical protein